ncbi:alpha-acetolactate decarboxylase [Paracnuella aquatica]|nr:alpha-acetolactate decarboxylase [Paracnuella aquatica]
MNYGKMILVLAIILSASSAAQAQVNEVKVVGQMRDVMWKGELQGKIYLDTIANKNALYGFGPVEYLSGEILVIDGKAYKSVVVGDTAMRVEETYNIKAPFFGYANIARWKEQSLPDSVETIAQLEQYLDRMTKGAKRPFLFRLSGTVKSAAIHIVNLPKGATVSSPDEAHRGQQNYKVTNATSDIIGFFSTTHKAIFTHHDTFLHMHLITADRAKMGHVDELLFEKGSMKLYLPAE